jgi:hypothetical protein
VLETAYRKRIANCVFVGPNRTLSRKKTTQKCDKLLQFMQSHCRGQGFDSPQLHQPEGVMTALGAVAEARSALVTLAQQMGRRC